MDLNMTVGSAWITMLETFWIFPPLDIKLYGLDCMWTIKNKRTHQTSIQGKICFLVHYSSPNSWLLGSRLLIAVLLCVVIQVMSKLRKLLNRPAFVQCVWVCRPTLLMKGCYHCWAVRWVAWISFVQLVSILLVWLMATSCWDDQGLSLSWQPAVLCVLCFKAFGPLVRLWFVTSCLATGGRQEWSSGLLRKYTGGPVALQKGWEQCKGYSVVVV